MTKNDFLNTLYQSLLYLPAKERQEILQDYEEHFAAGIEEARRKRKFAARLAIQRKLHKLTCNKTKRGPVLTSRIPPRILRL
jgi:hypothetical protein